MGQTRATIQAFLIGALLAGCATAATSGTADYGTDDGGASSSGGGGSQGDSSTGAASPDAGKVYMGPSSPGSGASSGASGGGGNSGTSTGGNGSSGVASSGSGSSSSGSSGSSTTGPITTTGNGPKIPAVMGTCPTIATGTVQISGVNVVLTTGKKGSEASGPVFFYWHGTGSSCAAESFGESAVITDIENSGGVFACFEGSTKMGTDTGDAVYFTGDFAMADQVLACAISQGYGIDTRRIYTGGCSAGGLQAGWMLYGRSSYLAAVMPNSGGIVIAPQLEDPSHVPALVTTHGKMGTDVVVIDFSQTSATEDKDVVAKGGFAVDCNHGGGHCGAPAADIAGQWQFCKDHPFGVSPEPYAKGLPSSMPSYCTIITK